MQDPYTKKQVTISLKIAWISEGLTKTYKYQMAKETNNILTNMVPATCSNELLHAVLHTTPYSQIELWVKNNIAETAKLLKNKSFIFKDIQ